MLKGGIATSGGAFLPATFSRNIDSLAIRWSRSKSGAGMPSPVIVGDHLYFFGSTAVCYDKRSGEEKFRKRMPGGSQAVGSIFLSCHATAADAFQASSHGRTRRRAFRSAQPSAPIKSAQGVPNPVGSISGTFVITRLIDVLVHSSVSARLPYAHCPSPRDRRLTPSTRRAANLPV